MKAASLKMLPSSFIDPSEVASLAKDALAFYLAKHSERKESLNPPTAIRSIDLKSESFERKIQRQYQRSIELFKESAREEFPLPKSVRKREAKR